MAAIAADNSDDEGKTDVDSKGRSDIDLVHDEKLEDRIIFLLDRLESQFGTNIRVLLEAPNIGMALISEQCVVHWERQTSAWP